MATITPEMTWLILKTARKQLAEGGQIYFERLSELVHKKYYEYFHPKMIKRLYEAEKDNPKYAPREIEEEYIRTKK